MKKKGLYLQRSINGNVFRHRKQLQPVNGAKPVLVDVAKTVLVTPTDNIAAILAAWWLHSDVID